jgi:phage gpG-like protein
MADSPGFTSYSVDNDQRFRNALARAQAQVRDLRIPLTLIAKDFFRSQKAIWALKSPGQYPDLAPSTKKKRDRDGQPYYPILRGKTGFLEQSMTDPRDANSINQIINKDTLILGTAVSYGIFHQSDKPRSKIPLRKFLFIGPEAPRFANSDQAGRPNRWMNILNDFVLEKLAAEKIGEVG